MLNFDFLKKDLGLVSLPHFGHDFSRKVSNVILLNDQISLPYLILLLEISGNMCIVIVCYPVCDVVNFENLPSAIISRRFPT